MGIILLKTNCSSVRMGLGLLQTVCCMTDRNSTELLMRLAGYEKDGISIQWVHVLTLQMRLWQTT